MNERWVAAAAMSDFMAAELLLRLKQSSSSDSPPLAAAASAAATSTATASLNRIGWGERKSRSKPSATATVSGKGQQQRSPSTPLSWSGGGGPSTSDGDDESSRASDLFEGDRSVKVDMHQKPKNEKDGFVRKSCDNELEIENKKRRFVLPDLNQTPIYEEMDLP